MANYKELSDTYNNISLNRNNSLNYIIDSNYLENELNKTIEENKYDRKYTEKDKINFLERLSKIQIAISKNEDISDLYSYEFYKDIENFVNNEKTNLSSFDNSIEVIESCHKNLEDTANKHSYEISNSLQNLRILQYKFQTDASVELEKTENFKGFENLNLLYNLLMPKFCFGEKYQFSNEAMEHHIEVLTSDELLKLSDKKNDLSLTIHMDSYLNKIKKSFKDAYLEIIRNKASINNIANEYMQHDKVKTSVIKNFMINKMIDENINFKIDNDSGNNEKILFFKDGSIIKSNSDNVDLEIKDFDVLKKEIGKFIYEHVNSLIPENSSHFLRHLKADFSNMYNVLHYANEYKNNSNLFTNIDISKLNESELFKTVNDITYNYYIKENMYNILEENNLKFVNDYTLLIMKDIYELKSNYLNDYLKEYLPNVESTDDLNFHLTQSLNMFNGFNKEQYLIKADKVKAPIIKTKDNKLIVELKNAEQCKEFMEHSFVKNIKENLIYTFVVFDFDRCPSDKKSELALDINLNNGIYSYKFKEDNKYSKMENNEFSDLTNLIISKSPRIKSKLT